MSLKPGIVPNRTTPPADHFVATCRAAAAARLDGRGADPEDRLTSDDLVGRFLLNREHVKTDGRAAVDPGSSSAAGWAAEVARQAWADYLVSLAPYNASARLIAQAVAARASGEYSIHHPVRTSGPEAPAWVAENNAIPVAAPTFEDVEVGPARKLAHMVVWSYELQRRSDAAAIFDTMLREDVSAGLDAAFLSTTAASSSAHAGLLNGLTPVTGFAGGDLTAIETDLVALIDATAAGGSGELMFIANAKQIGRLRIKAPRLAAGLDLVVSASVPDGRVIAADGRSLVVSIDPAPLIDASTHAALHMSNTPTAIVSSSGPTTAAPVRSLWQTASVAARVIHEIAFAKRRTNAVAFVEGATW
ncbi:phage major capsid protein [Thalassobaculum sp.]|uniref:phage major capsid protein n=1 Tax=Thalassobaculum sp. TaxID=2022740 RepID=UPI003B595570